VAGLAAFVADSRQLQAPHELLELMAAVSAVSAYGGHAAAAAFAAAQPAGGAGAAEPGFFDGVAWALSAPLLPRGDVQMLSRQSFEGQAVTALTISAGSLVHALTQHPTPELLRCRPALLEALEAGAARARTWGQASKASGDSLGDSDAQQVVEHLNDAADELRALKDADVAAGALEVLGIAGPGGGGDDGVACAKPESSTDAGARRCEACGRVDGGDGGGNPLLACAGCKGVLEVFFCNVRWERGRSRQWVWLHALVEEYAVADSNAPRFAFVWRTSGC
jgi:hypothetical protein